MEVDQIYSYNMNEVCFVNLKNSLKDKPVIQSHTLGERDTQN